MRSLLLFCRRFIEALWNIVSKWVSLIVLVGYTILHIVVNPSFVFFMLIALGLSTMGIWIEIFPFGYTPEKSIISQIQSISVFTFSIATLGSMATAYVFENKGEDNLTLEGFGYPKWVILVLKSNSELLKHSIFFLWIVSVLSAFFALKSSAGVSVCLFLTFSMWAIDNIRKPIFRTYNRSARDNLTVDYTAEADDSSDSEIVGGGLR